MATSFQEGDLQSVCPSRGKSLPKVVHIWRPMRELDTT